jgi:hypothetical protein
VLFWRDGDERASEPPGGRSRGCYGDARGFDGVACDSFQELPRPIERDTLLRIDTCWSAATGLAMVDVIGSSDFIIRHFTWRSMLEMHTASPGPWAIESAARSTSPMDSHWRRLARESKGNCDAQRKPSRDRAVHPGGRPNGHDAWPIQERLGRSPSRRWRSCANQCVGVTWELNTAQNLAVWATAVPRRVRRAVAAASGAAGQRAEQRELVCRHRIVHQEHLRVAGGRPA